jgi:hypothetical protein
LGISALIEIGAALVGVTGSFTRDDLESALEGDLKDDLICIIWQAGSALQAKQQIDDRIDADLVLDSYSKNTLHNLYSQDALNDVFSGAYPISHEAYNCQDGCQPTPPAGAILYTAIYTPFNVVILGDDTDPNNVSDEDGWSVVYNSQDAIFDADVPEAYDHLHLDVMVVSAASSATQVGTFYMTGSGLSFPWPIMGTDGGETLQSFDLDIPAGLTTGSMHPSFTAELAGNYVIRRISLVGSFNE